MQVSSSPHEHPSPGTCNENQDLSMRKNQRMDGRKVKQIRGRRGALKGLIEMPLDILCEIFGHLYPVDILHLAQTSKALRNILMQKSFAFVWKMARANVKGLPDLPPNLTEPQYAKLIFDPFCDYCSEIKTQSIVSNYSRCCRKCASEPSIFCSTLDDIDSSIVPSLSVPTDRRRLWRAETRYSVRDAVRLSSEYAKLDVDARASWLNEKREELQLWQININVYKEWIAAEPQRRACELEDVRQGRYLAIQHKLVELGWGEEMEKMAWSKLRYLPCVRHPKHLTERVWNNIRSTVIQYMEDIKAQRLRTEFRATQKDRRRRLAQIYERYVALQPIYVINPPIADVITMESEPIKAILDSVDETPILRRAILETLFKFTHIWRHSKDAELLTIMRTCTDIDTDVQESSLSLATTFFLCNRTGCGSLLAYPHVLVHACLTLPRRNYVDTNWDIFEDLGCVPWSVAGNLLSFHHSAYKTARTLLQACRLNPNTTTVQELSNMDLFIECLDCNKLGDTEKKRSVMTWLPAVKHALYSGVWHQTDEIHMRQAGLNLEEIRLATTLEARKRADLAITANSSQLWVCIICRKVSTWGSLAHHLRSHNDADNAGTTDPREFEDYVLHLDSHTKRIPGEVLWLPIS